MPKPRFLYQGHKEALMKSDRRTHVPYDNHDRRRGRPSQAHRARLHPLAWVFLLLGVLALGVALGRSQQACEAVVGSNSRYCVD